MSLVRKLRVLVVDDSAVMRQMISRMVSQMPEAEVVATASDAFEAREKLVALCPDVMTLDIDMPRLDGLAFLEKAMKHFPTPTIVVSSRAVKGSDVEKRALEIGAIAAIEKPKTSAGRGFQDAATEIRLAVLEAGRQRALPKFRRSTGEAPVVSSGTPSAFSPAIGSGSPLSEELLSKRMIAIASSTGGTEALKVVLRDLPVEVPPIVVVQHMPPMFTSQYAGHLQEICAFQVREARDGEMITPGTLFLAPGDFHMEVERRGGLRIRLHQEAMMHGVRPAADHLFESVARTLGANALGVVLTGMGRDGAAGLLKMKNSGAATLVQDERTSVVFGMPKAAIDLGAADQVVPLERISAKMMSWLQAQSKPVRKAG